MLICSTQQEQNQSTGYADNSKSSVVVSETLLATESVKHAASVSTADVQKLTTSQASTANSSTSSGEYGSPTGLPGLWHKSSSEEEDTIFGSKGGQHKKHFIETPDETLEDSEETEESKFLSELENSTINKLTDSLSKLKLLSPKKVKPQTAALTYEVDLDDEEVVFQVKEVEHNVVKVDDKQEHIGVPEELIALNEDEHEHEIDLNEDAANVNQDNAQGNVIVQPVGNYDNNPNLVVNLNQNNIVDILPIIVDNVIADDNMTEALSHLAPSAFHGNDSKDLIKFMRSFEQWALYKAMQEANQLAMMPLFFKDSADIWFSQLPDDKKDTLVHHWCIQGTL